MNTRKSRNVLEDGDLNGIAPSPKRPRKANKTQNKPERCKVCKQYIQDVVLYNGHPNKSCEEFIALTDEKLSLFTGKEETVHEGDAQPTHKITNYSVYDSQGHLCFFDTGLIEKDVLLHLSGYIKPIYDEDSSPENGIPAHDLGPINEWFNTGFDGGERALVGIVTPYAQYILMEPSDEYAPFVKVLRQKIALLKMVIEFVLDNAWNDPNYEDLLFHLESSGNSDLSEDLLLQHAQFICNQIYSYDQAGDDDDKPMITISCVRTLVKMSGVTFRERKQIRLQQGKTHVKKTKGFTKATTTELVRSIFENFFPDQINAGKDVKGPKKKRCGVCEACQSPDCGKCSHCKDMLKFGGPNKGKQACKTRRCPNMAVQDAEQSENECDMDDVKETPNKKVIDTKKTVNKVEWPGKPVAEIKGRTYYDSALVGDSLIKPGDFVMLSPSSPAVPLYVGKIQYMFDKALQGPTIHVHIFCRGTDTILGETADPQQLFVQDVCENCPLASVVRKAEVTFREIPKNWSELGGTEHLPSQAEDDGRTFFYTKRYISETATFVDYVDEKPQENNNENFNSCVCCMRAKSDKMFNKPTFKEDTVEWRGETYKAGWAVFLDPSVYEFRSSYQENDENEVPKKVDEEKYPEYYRKTSDVKGSNRDTPEPFCIGRIERLYQKGDSVKIDARIFFRPEDTKGSVFLAYEKDLNLVYWTDEIITVNFNKVAGRCYLVCADTVEDPERWAEEGPYRFYFSEAYNPKTFEYGEVPDHAKKIGYMGKGKGKGKGKSQSSARNIEPDQPRKWDKIERPLRCMDVFAGCGGLSNGLHRAGIAETKWAIEIEPTAAHAFKLNNQDCKVFSDDCNDLLQQVLTDKDAAKEKGLPCKGDVELLVGGPPCQGFSGMNRFNAGQYSLFKNSLIVSFLSYCDYYRPNYVVLENVRNFISFKRSMVLKLTVRCLEAIGYQVTFGVLQAGQYGIPQTRRRLVLMAAAPGHVLPKLPEPKNVFNKRGCHLSFALDGNKYTNGNLWQDSAPYRTICVRDAISDLPDIKNGWNKTEMPYDSDAVSHFQRKMRGSKNPNPVLFDHTCKEMAPIVEARIAHVPTMPGSDWRDLPNISVTLSDGTLTNKLHYSYMLKRQKPDEPLRGVCQCAGGAPCDPTDRQLNTLIPWCLPHTADRHNHWSGLYGRLEWDGFFSTTITNPEPMGKQGRVLHPEENRVVSVRECARSQGFPDQFKFYGSVVDKHRQVGNAVPPPLAEAVGFEIRKALAKTQAMTTAV